MPNPNRLITIPVSHYCEKTRWALQRLQIPFVEEPHMPPFHRFATRGLADPTVPIDRPKNLSALNQLVLKTVGGQTVPVLVTEQGIFRSSDEILNYADSIAPEALKLYPTDPTQRQQVDALVNEFDTILAPAVRLWAYSYIMNQPDLVKPLWCQGVPAFESRLFSIVFPWMRTNVSQLYGISDTSKDEAYEIICDSFDRVNGLLSDGRAYLVGDRFSAADLSFATLSAAVLAIPKYSVPLPDLNQLPPTMASQIQQFQQTIAGDWVLKLYQEHLALILGDQE
jgi:glutathione S-transferase